MGYTPVQAFPTLGLEDVETFKCLTFSLLMPNPVEKTSMTWFIWSSERFDVSSDIQLSTEGSIVSLLGLPPNGMLPKGTAHHQYATLFANYLAAPGRLTSLGVQ